ncbi:hypothetical protein [Stygiolobus caldivivus]|uniref:Uncharacterized protein n=1 Tax=Stygiolobus caldivivus TaxID=2824673 RepID=A0A8D5U755_9CREN|nr:hypothetical protein [Stygiolobus caldivivus]BCU70295.1 hypothetical protein KN1_15920 [Stygiolobus caldivivus]
MALLRRGEKKIFHIDSLNQHMREVIKTVMDVNLNDVVRYYGLRYLSPKIGEPIFIPYGRLDGNFRKFEDAFDKLYEEIEKVKEEGLRQYSEWYPNSMFLNHYRIVFYSYTDQDDGVLYGIGAEPLAVTPTTSYPIDKIQDGDVVVGMQLFNIALMKGLKLKFYDLIRDRREEIIEAYNWLYTQFHAKYDTKDKVFLTDIATYYMKRFFGVIDNLAKNTEFATELKGKRAIVPIVESRAKKDGPIKEVMEKEFYDYIDQGNYYKVEAIPAIYNREFVGKLLKAIMNGFDEILLLSEKKIQIPEELKELKVTDQGERFVLLSK